MENNSNLTPVDSAVPPAGVEDTAALAYLAWPQWLVYHRILETGNNLTRWRDFESRDGLAKTLKSVWRCQESYFVAKLELVLQQKLFYEELIKNGCHPAMANCLQALYKMADPQSSAQDFELAKSAANALLPEISSGLSSGAIKEPAKWPPSVRSAYLLRIRANNGQRLATATDTLNKAQLKAIKNESKRKLDQEKGLAQAEATRINQERVEAAAIAHRLSVQKSMDFWFKEQAIGSDHFPLLALEQLQSGDLLDGFILLNGVNPSPTALKKLFSLNAETYAALVSHREGLEKIRRDQIAARLQWELALIRGCDLPAVLGITKAEYDEWLAKKRIPIAKRESFRKWGQSNEVILHHPEQLTQITPEQVQSWRDSDDAAMTPQARAARKRSVDKARAKLILDDAVAQVPKLHGCRQQPTEAGVLCWTKDVELIFKSPVAGNKGTWSANVKMETYVPVPANETDVLTLAAKVGAAFSASAQAEMATRLANGVSDVLANYCADLTDEEKLALYQCIRTSLSQGVAQSSLESGKFTQILAKGPVLKLLEGIESQRAQNLLKLKDYPQSFPLARSLNRKIHFKIGPTNSGKTYEALEALKQASFGVYLAPLRLLAMEIRDRLMSQGVACNLLTGEEHDMVPGARHTACTVEMMNPTHEVQVAVIDEIQMLDDTQRGWAWTSALVGVPAQHVYVCGAGTSHKSCINVLDAMGEAHDTVTLERKTPLSVEPSPVSKSRHTRNTHNTRKNKSKKGAAQKGEADQNSGQNTLRKGDAIVAFSRKDVLTLSARYRDQGFSVATIYGALSPEVRRTEAERFCSGEADIVVATDAIGMGLNLPIRRVIFSTTHKFDGIQTRKLQPVEVLQIGGRAGRFGIYPAGFVSAFDQEDLKHVRNMLTQSAPNQSNKLSISPGLWHVEALSDMLKTQKIGAVLSFFANRIATDSPIFRTASLGDVVGLGHAVDSLAPDLSLRDKFTFSCAPVSIDKEKEAAYFSMCLKSYAAGKKQALPKPGSWLDEEISGHLETAEQLSKDLSLYAWLSFKFSGVFHQFELLPALRRQVSSYIEAELLSQDGFGETSKEAFVRRQFDYY